MVTITLRDVIDADLEVLFQNQRDPEANHMAAFTARDPSDREAFDAHWARIRASETVLIKTILAEGVVVGSVLSYEMEGETEISYWIGRAYWGKGIMSEALSQFLTYQTIRPLSGRAAADNIGSLRVMEKCGFMIIGEEMGFAIARGKEIKEIILRLE